MDVWVGFWWLSIIQAQWSPLLLLTTMPEGASEKQGTAGPMVGRVRRRGPSATLPHAGDRALPGSACPRLWRWRGVRAGATLPFSLQQHSGQASAWLAMLVSSPQHHAFSAWLSMSAFDPQHDLATL